MLSIIGTYWCGIFLDAYKYSCSYLLFTVTSLVALLLCIYIYERPRLLKVRNFTLTCILFMLRVLNSHKNGLSVMSAFDK